MDYVTLWAIIQNIFREQKPLIFNTIIDGNCWVFI